MYGEKKRSRKLAAAEAERLVLDVLRRFPKNHLVLVNAAKFYLDLGDILRATELLEQDDRLFPALGSRALIERLKGVPKK